MERLTRGGRRADVVGIFPNEDAVKRLISAVLMVQNDEWQTQNRYMQIKDLAAPQRPLSSKRRCNSHRCKISPKAA